MIEYYLMSVIFGVALIFETMVTGKLFLHKDNLPISSAMKWWAVGSVMFISLLNVLGFLRLHVNYTSTGIDPGNYVQAAFAVGVLSLFAWVWVFHLERWKKNYGG